MSKKISQAVKIAATGYLAGEVLHGAVRSCREAEKKEAPEDFLNEIYNGTPPSTAARRAVCEVAKKLSDKLDQVVDNKNSR